MQVQVVPIDAVVPYARNPRKNGAAVDRVASSLREYGWRQPIVVDEQNTVVVGHTRLLAAKKLGFKEVPIHVAKGLTQSQIKAYRIADNKAAEFATWDDELLRLEIEDLKLEGFDVSLTLMGDEDLARLQPVTVGLTDADAAPEAPVEPVSKPGDIYVLGRHRLMCGDSTVATDVERLLAGVKPHLMVTDPPYGVEYEPASARASSVGSAKGVVLNDDRADWREAWALFPGEIAYVWHAGLRAKEVVESLEATGFEMRAQIIWDKTRPIMSRGHYHFQHEPCWYAVRKGGTAHWSGDRKQSTVWAIEHRRSDTGHGTQKPVECMKRPIENNSSPGQAVYEPFSGSGTTIIAAEMTGRCCYAMELSPAYVDVAVKRWEDFTGQKAVREQNNG